MAFAMLMDHVHECPEGLVDGPLIRKHRSHIVVEFHEVGAFPVPRRAGRNPGTPTVFWLDCLEQDLAPDSVCEDVAI
jgi:hypothetical protein